MAFIILADDDPFIGGALRAILEPAGYVVGVVPDGVAALAAIKLKSPDLAILDVNMPGLSGTEVVRQLRSSNEAYAVPILMLTTLAHEADVQIALRAGADDYLTKPFDPDQLLARVDRLAGGRQKQF